MILILIFFAIFCEMGPSFKDVFDHIVAHAGGGGTHLEKEIGMIGIWIGKFSGKVGTIF